ncbi:uncharacterized protein A1O9_10319 [Exophiala aquamarina CBS 119918]|uniref:Cyclohexanone monooxygenase n=1 Tax=Exophiala aquamarina CBS 119918 TaxID=1182545 RepID=A0A072NZR6_9EURO|nr:uncharacterized protein A1O9_10319 [Exophiala aquamarina CBS 119918]KEF53344.1 hypothetical protein A1O9_10319 [Exophiala aquamarina CBS 119918]
MAFSNCHQHVNGVSNSHYDAIVIGAGMSGIRMLHDLKKRGIDGKCFEAGSGIGGTWYWNRYPGARADSESWVYILTFLEEIGMDYKWKERFPTQPELERYLNEVVDYLKLRDNFVLNTRIGSAHYDDSKNIWHVTTSKGEKHTCDFLITAAGPLSTPLKPPFRGLDSFKGEYYQTALWPDKKVDFTGKRVGIFGTGATGVQLVPLIAHAAKKLTVFQRTPNYVLPGRNFVFSEGQERELKQDFNGIAKRVRAQPFGGDMGSTTRTFLNVKDKEALNQAFDYGWEQGGFRYIFETVNDMLTNVDCNEAASEFLRKKIRALVHDPVTAETLCPYYPLMSKRPPLGHFYYEAFNRPNVELVDIKKDPVEEITPTGLRTLAREFELDIIIFAIGFDAVTGTLDSIDIRGNKGKPLKAHLESNLATAYGITTAGFPNLFMVLGPQSVWANLPVVIDNTVDWIGKTMSHMRESGHKRIDTKTELTEKWKEEVDKQFWGTLLGQGARATGAWHVGGNVEGKPLRCYWYFGGVPAYIEHCDQEIESGYPGFIFSNPIEAH